MIDSKSDPYAIELNVIRKGIQTSTHHGFSLIPAIPLWHMPDAMDLDEAVITASTLSFAGHYLIAHFVLYGMIGRRAISTPRSPAFVRKAG